MTFPPTGSGAGSTARSMLRRAITADDQRPSARHEHACTMLAAVALALHALTTPRRSHAVVEGIAAGALLFRAASGSDGLRSWCGAASARPAAPVAYSPEPAPPMSGNTA